MGTDINERVVTIEGCLVTKSIQQEEKYRRQLIKTLTPFGYGNVELIGKSFRKGFSRVQIVDGPNFKNEDYNAPDGILYFNFTFIAPGNFLEDLDDTVVQLSEVLPLFEFELEFGETIEFGTITNSEINLLNDGEAETPIVVEIPGPIQTPQLINKTTGEFIKVHTPIFANERMIINTSFGNKVVEIVDDTGARRNAFHYIDLDSTFFQLIVGRNLLKFSAEVGNDTAKAFIYFRKNYLGI